MSFKPRPKKSKYKPSKSEYDLPRTKVKKVDAVAWLAQIVYPADTPTEGRKKVRTSMRYYNISGKVLNAPAFFHGQSKYLTGRKNYLLFQMYLMNR